MVEQWNGAMDFMFFARRGEMGSNRREDHEISMLALHLIQNCMVYVNTLMIPAEDAGGRHNGSGVRSCERRHNGVKKNGKRDV